MSNLWYEEIKKRFPEQYERMQKYGRRNVSFNTVAPTGCSKYDSIVTSQEGFYKLEELCNLSKKGFSNLNVDINVLQDNTISKSTKSFNNGYAQTKIITLDSGIELESTLNHQYKVFTEDSEYEWKRVDELVEGDLIVSRIGGYNKIEEPELTLVEYKGDDTKYWQFKPKDITLPSFMNPEFAELLGIIYGDGSVHTTGLRVSCNYNSLQIDRTVELVEKVFKFKPTISKEHTCISVNISSQILLKFLQANRLLKEKACNVEIPLLIRTASKKSIEAFLQGYWMADGSQTNNTKYIDTCSKQMAQQLLVMYRGIGINAKIGTYTNRENSLGKNPIYRVYQKGFGSIDFDKYKYIKNFDKKVLKSLREFGEELFFDKVVDLTDSHALTLDIEVPNKNMYLLNSSISHNTVSLLTQTTSGLEPLFMPFYMRRKKVNGDERVDFVDEIGDKWQEFPVLHEKFKDWIKVQIEKNPNDWDGFRTDIKEDLQRAFEISPWYGSTANDIDWIKRVEIQGIIQKYITHSISSTINLPNDVTEQEVSEIYLEAWKKGLKGVTVYRDGSRSGVLVSETEKPELVTFNENHAPKRPKSLVSKVVRFNNNKEKWIAFVGLMDNKPYEVFTGKAENVDLPLSIEVGEIKKVKDEDGNKRYDFIYDGGSVEGISNISSPDYWNYGKLISGMLRHGMPLQFVVDTVQNLTWDSDHINTWKAGMARALKKFIKDGKVEGIKCTDCGGGNIIFQEGCLSCKDCGGSKCG